MAHRNPQILPKEVHYNVNGSGRDSYIWWENGGNFKVQPDRSKGFERGTFGEKHKYKPINEYRLAKHIHYVANGTGRDTYINTDQGGLSAVKERPNNFIRTLRGASLTSVSQNQSKTYFRQDDTFTRSQFSPFKNTNMAKTKQFVVDQKLLTQKLSVPKQVENPYKDIGHQTFFPKLRSYN